MTGVTFPHGARFAFTIIDDTDVATLENVRPFYELLTECGLRTTKTVWPVGCPEGSHDYVGSATLEDPGYLAYMRELRDRGFELTWHGATMETSRRERTLAALEALRRVLGVSPRVHANHAYNRENLYWGADRLDNPVLRSVFGRLAGVPRDHYRGHVRGSDYWWGDLAQQHVEYGRNLTFLSINTLRVNPSMPYRDAKRPLVPWWFSASDAEDADAFVRLVSDANVDRLEREGGACIVATHVGKGFAPGGRLHRGVERAVRAVAARNGWFVPVGTLLDHLRAQRDENGALPRGEWRRMQWRWALDSLRQRVLARRRVPAGEE
jgi:hypothetical protein